MSEAPVNLVQENGIATLTLSRPDKRNALNRDLLIRLQRAVTNISTDESVRLVVLAAKGAVFCAGMDLQEMQQRATQPDANEQWDDDTRLYADVLESLRRLPMPTLAVVQGPVLAGGVGLVLACDLALAADLATFALPEPKRGITAAIVAPYLIRRIGVSHASYLLLSGRTVKASDAHRMGLCHEVVPIDKLPERTDELIASILTGAPSALRATKQHMAACSDEQLSEQLEAGRRLSSEARRNNEAREGLAAFLEKRPSAWDPR